MTLVKSYAGRAASGPLTADMEVTVGGLVEKIVVPPTRTQEEDGDRRTQTTPPETSARGMMLQRAGLVCPGGRSGSEDDPVRSRVVLWTKLVRA